MCVGAVLRQKTLVFVVLVVFFALIATEAFAGGAPITVDSSWDEGHVGQGKIQAHISEIPLSFIANAGQADANVQFMGKASEYTIFFTRKEVVFAASEGTEDKDTRGSVVRLRFAGANGEVKVEGEKPLPGVANFFLGNDPEQWRAYVPTYAAITYHDLYPGIDLVYSGKQGRLKNEFVVAAGADPTLIIMEYSGATSMYVREDGALVLETPIGELVEAPLLIYQMIDEERITVDGGYRLLGNGEVAFTFGDYIPTEPLIIDPEIVYSTYLGGNDDDAGMGTVVDRSGNVYIAGTTSSTDFPTKNPLQSGYGRGDDDVFVAKLDPTGLTLIYSTYLGGSDDDWGLGIAVDSSGNAYITGGTESRNFPTKNPLQPDYVGGEFDAFVATLGPTGSTLVYSTYLGGSGEDVGMDIAVDRSGNVYIIGMTESRDFPTKNPLQSNYGGGDSDAFVAKLDPTGLALIYSTYLGGSDDDWGLGIAVDNSGNAYITGGTESRDFPTKNPLQSNYGGGNDYDLHDAFVAKLDSTGSTLVYSTYLGGSGWDGGNGIAVDSSGNAYITGGTESRDFPTKNPLQPNYGGGNNRDLGDAFVVKLDPTGLTLIYSTYLGGSDDDGGGGIAVDRSGNVYIIGMTESRDFPTEDSLQPNYGGGDSDAFVAKLDPTGLTLIYSTYLGGSDGDGGIGIAVDSSGNVYITGGTESRDFPTEDSLQPDYGEGDKDKLAGRMGGHGDAFVAKIGAGETNQPPIANAGPDQIITDADGNGQEEITLDGSKSADPDGTIESYLWTGEGTTHIASGEEPTVVLPVGTHIITLTAIDNDGITNSDETIITVTPSAWYTEDDVVWLARIIMSEASIGNQTEREAVGWTVLTRFGTDNYYGLDVKLETIEQVICPEHGWGQQYACNQDPTQEVIELARSLLNGEIQDPTSGATQFFSPTTMPKEWNDPSGYDTGGGLYHIPEPSQIAEKVYFPSWAANKDESSRFSVFCAECETDKLAWVQINNVRNDKYMLYKPKIYKITVALQCPAELRVYDQLGRVTGLVDGKVKEEIPGANYSANSVLVYYPTDSYRYEVVGTDDGTYSLVASADTSRGETGFKAIDMAISPHTTHQFLVNWAELSELGQGVTIQIDNTSDGTFEASYRADAEFDGTKIFNAQKTKGVSAGLIAGIIVGTLSLIVAGIILFHLLRSRYYI